MSKPAGSAVKPSAASTTTAARLPFRHASTAPAYLCFITRPPIANLIIRAVRPEDYEQWLPLWDGYNAFYGRSGPTALAPEITRTTWDRFFDASEPVHALVAEQDGQLLGLVHYLYHRTTTTVDLVCYLNDLFTNAAARGKGVGRALILAVYDEARRAGSPRVYWHTHETNATARRLYDKVADDTGFIFYRKQF